MPYIPLENRGPIDTYVKKLAQCIHDVGEMNYAITTLLLEINPRMSYANAVVVLGTLDAVSKEWYRRWVAPYEDDKCKANGEVYKR